MPRPHRNPAPAITFAASHRQDAWDRRSVSIAAAVEDRTAGRLLLSEAGDDDLTAACLRHVQQIRRRHAEGDNRPIGVMVVSHVFVEPWARSMGVGVALYAEAARIAARRYHAMIVADACVDGQTSAEAQRVWGSDRFQRATDVVDHAAYWTDDARFQNPSPRTQKSRGRR